jgi:DNA-binding transcriptional ArsR family regulator
MSLTLFEIQADFCKAMGNATRLQILHVLRVRPMNVSDIAQITELSQSQVSRQLSVLRNVGVVQCHRQANEMIYEFTDENIGEVCDLVRKVLSKQMHRQTEALQ